MEELTDRDEIRSILDKSPVINMRMYSLVDSLDDNPDCTCYRNNSAMLLVSWSLGMYVKYAEDIIPLLDNIPAGRDWFLNGIDARVLPELERRFPGQVTINDDCYAWTLEEAPQEIVELDSLELEDAKLINENWSYKSENSLEHIEWFISTFPSSVIRGNEGQPVAWSFIYEESPYHMNMGGLFVLPAYRQQGFARRITLDMCRKVYNKGKKPLVHVNVNNEASQSLVTKLNFVSHERVIFGRLKL
ncbi:MAG: GNAT family N-acetyltransferase [Candidatus Odinarchaeota archaeon]